MSLPPRRPPDEPPSLAERVGCFTFVLLPLLLGIPIFRAWAQVVGDWILYAYGVVMVLAMGFIIYLLEREEPK